MKVSKALLAVALGAVTMAADCPDETAREQIRQLTLYLGQSAAPHAAPAANATVHAFNQRLWVTVCQMMKQPEFTDVTFDTNGLHCGTGPDHTPPPDPPPYE